MAAEDLSLCLSVPGKLAYNPTQGGLLAAYPHSGTALGKIRDFTVEEDAVEVPIVAEEWGSVVGATRGETVYRVSFVLEQWDPDALALIYRTTTSSAGGYQGAKTITNNLPGVLTPASPLVFSPDDKRNPGLVFYSPIFYTGPVARRLAFDLSRRLEIPVWFWAGRHATVQKSHAIDRLEHLSLTS